MPGVCLQALFKVNSAEEREAQREVKDPLCCKSSILTHLSDPKPGLSASKRRTKAPKTAQDRSTQTVQNSRNRARESQVLEPELRLLNAVSACGVAGVLPARIRSKELDGPARSNLKHTSFPLFGVAIGSKKRNPPSSRKIKENIENPSLSFRLYFQVPLLDSLEAGFALGGS